NPTSLNIGVGGFSIKNQGPSDAIPELLYTFDAGTILAPGQSFLLMSNLATDTSAADATWAFKDIPDGQAGEVLIWIEDSGGTSQDMVSIDNSAGGPFSQLPPSPYYFLRSWIRTHDGCQDSGAHLVDFEFHFVATDRNSASPFKPCS
ncbi:MAG: hypothetical protein V3V01_00725, partial [Acidimicrobiales bacterium]